VKSRIAEGISRDTNRHGDTWSNFLYEFIQRCYQLNYLEIRDIAHLSRQRNVNLYLFGKTQ